MPLKMLQPVAEAVTGRLEDKANLVRKNATQLLTTMMQFNPYHAKLSLSFFQDKNKACKALLDVRSLPHSLSLSRSSPPLLLYSVILFLMLRSMLVRRRSYISKMMSAKKRKVVRRRTMDLQ